MMIQVIFEEIEYKDPITYFNCLSDRPWAVFLDSADAQDSPGNANQYSFIAVEPFKIICLKNGGKPFAQLRSVFNQFKNFESHPELPPFQGGICGLFSYDLLHYLEDVPRPHNDDMQFKDLAVGCYDLVLSFDHGKKKAYIISSGLPETGQIAREKKAGERLLWLKTILKKNKCYHFPRQPLISESEIESNFTEQDYAKAVRKTIDYIKSGDIFEVNISQRFEASMPCDVSAYDVYHRLRKINPAPFSAYFNHKDVAIASASPERFLKVKNDDVEARPIKGTRERGKNAEEDNQLAKLLIDSEKDRAENIMIVDLMRNDLSRVCDDHSIKVEKLCGLESFPTVHHLVSVVKGKLKKNKSVIDLLEASFPGGSITGAPKIRSMEIIHEIEPNQRGPYCGSIGYIGFNGCMDLSIVIRTICIKKGKLTFQVGGAIVLDSDPVGEYKETLQKARAMNIALTSRVEQ
jgi:para-aminobenzoate synthetase component 1